MESWFRNINFDLKRNNPYLNLYKYGKYNNYLLKLEICENTIKTHFHIHDKDYDYDIFDSMDVKLRIYLSLPEFIKDNDVNKSLYIHTYTHNPQYYYVSLKNYVKLVEYKIIHDIDLVTLKYLRYIDGGDNGIRGLIHLFLMEMILK